VSAVHDPTATHLAPLTQKAILRALNKLGLFQRLGSVFASWLGTKMEKKDPKYITIVNGLVAASY
jgi:hypothetical protein